MTKSEKQNHILKLMVLALNEALKMGIINLDGKSVEPPDDKSGFAEITLGGYPTIINWFDAGYDELRVTVWWDYRPELMPTWRKKHLGRFAPGRVPNVARRFFGYILGACGSCYLERRTGKFIVGEAGSQFFDVYVREDSVYDLNNMEPEQPAGYEIYGRISE